MKIIDAHMHFSKMDHYKKMANDVKTPSKLAEMEAWMASNNIILGIAMGIGDFRPETEENSPMLPDLDYTGNILLAPYSPHVACCLGVNPYCLCKNGNTYLNQIEKLLSLPYIVGIKIYLGYYPFFAYDDIYTPIYKLGCQYNVPVIFHTGDLSIPTGQLEYAHPLTIDKVATAFPNTTMVIAHLGNPWLIDAASVILKNDNVFADLSGLIVGDFDVTQVFSEQSGYFFYLKSALDYLFSYHKLMFASDWPFASPQKYYQLVCKVIPEKYHDMVFFQNALTVFGKLEKLI